jgi:hypothetical protein
MKRKRKIIIYTDGDSTTTAEEARILNLWVWERRRRGRKWDLVKRWGHLGNCIWLLRGWRKKWEAAVVAEAAIVVEWRIGKISYACATYHHRQASFFPTVSHFQPQVIKISKPTHNHPKSSSINNDNNFFFEAIIIYCQILCRNRLPAWKCLILT